MLLFYFACSVLAAFLLALADATLISADSIEGRPDEDVEPRRTLGEIHFTIGISLMNEDDNIPAYPEGAVQLKCFYCGAAKNGLTFLRTTVNTNMFVDQDGRRIFLEYMKMYDHGDINKVRQNYEEMAQNPDIVALLGPTWVGFNDVAAQAANKYDKLLIVWAFDAWNYYSNPGPLPSTANLPNGMPTIENLATNPIITMNSATNRRLQGAHAKSSCASDEQIESLSAPGLYARPDSVASFGEDESPNHKEFAPLHTPVRRLIRHDTPQTFDIFIPCKEDQFIKYPMYPSCHARAMRYNEKFADIAAGFSTTLMIIPAGLKRVRLDITTERRNEDFITFHVNSAVTGECLFGLLTTLNGNSTCKQENLKLCSRPKMMGTKDWCLNMPSGTKASIYRERETKETKFTMMFDQPAPVDMSVQIAFAPVANREANWNITLQHDGIDNCSWATLSRVVGCTDCNKYVCANQNGEERYSVCDGSPTVECSREPDPDGVMFDNSFTNVVDINVPATRWARDAIDKLQSKGARKWVFLYSDTPVPPRSQGIGSASWKRQCTQLAKYADSLAGDVSYEMFKFKDPLLYGSASDYVRVIRRIGADECDALVICAEMHSFLYLLPSMKTLQLEVKMILADRPLGASFSGAVFAYNALDMMEALPMTYDGINKSCPFFESLGDFQQQYGAAFTEFVSYAAMQISASGALLVDVLRSLPHAELTTERMMNHFRTNTVRTFWGDLNFDETGRRTASIGRSRMFVELATADSQSRFQDSSIPVVNDQLYIDSGCNYNNEPCQFASMKYITQTSFLLKMLRLFPCDLGCHWKRRTCVPCAAGRHRSPNDVVCRRCPKGKYADYGGASECKECMKGAYCEHPEMPPLPQARHFPVMLEANFSLEDELHWAKAPGSRCVSPHRREEKVVMIGCRPITVCNGWTHQVVDELKQELMDKLDKGQPDYVSHIDGLKAAMKTCKGDNTGVLCGQCKSGYTVGPLVGTRLCMKCFNLAITLVLVAVVGILHFMMGRFLSGTAWTAAHQANYIVCPMVRLMWHHAHCVGVIVESLRIDAETIVNIVMLPIDLFTRPFELSMGTCIWQKSTFSLRAVEDERNFAILIIPIAICMVMFIQVLGVVKNFGNLVLETVSEGVRACKKRSQERREARERKRIEKQKLEDDSSDEDEGTPAVADNVVSFSLDESNQENWSKLFGPGRRFVAMHDSFVKKEMLRTMTRQVCCIFFMLTPVSLRIFSRVSACMPVDVGGETRRLMTANPDVLCGTKQHEDLIGFAEIFLWVGICLPVVVIAYVNCRYVFNGWSLIIKDRETCCLLYDGFVPRYCWWESLLWLRTSLLVYAGASPSLMTRQLFCFWIVAIFLVLEASCCPWDDIGRGALKKYDVMASISLLLIVVAGVLCPYELEDDARYYNFPRSVKISICSTAIILNYLVLCSGLFTNMIYTGLTHLEAIMQQSPTDVDRLSSMMHKLIKVVYGLNPVAQIKRAHNKFLCVTKLSEAERMALVNALIETSKACIDSSTKFHTWLLDNAINQAFDRAVQARQATLRHLYSTHGSRSFFLFDFKFFKFGKVTLRPPDIDSDVAQVTEVNVGLGGPGWWNMEIGKEPEHWRNSVTVMEFHKALASVSYDVLEHHPSLHQDPAKHLAYLNPKEVEECKEQNKPHAEIATWQTGLDLKAFERDLKQSGAIQLKSQKELDEKYKDDREPDSDMWEKMEKFNKDFSGETDTAVRNVTLEKELQELEAACAQVRQQLIEMGDTELPDLEDDTEHYLNLEDMKIGEDDPTQALEDVPEGDGDATAGQGGSRSLRATVNSFLPFMRMELHRNTVQRQSEAQQPENDGQAPEGPEAQKPQLKAGYSTVSVITQERKSAVIAGSGTIRETVV